jgi:branched-chain amino acid transport system substrate-binding protein
VLKQCNGDFSSENILKQATNLKDFVPDLVQSGLTINTSPTDYFPFDKLAIARFDGKGWVATGDAPNVN